jgi:hypothetical protein
LAEGRGLGIKLDPQRSSATATADAPAFCTIGYEKVLLRARLADGVREQGLRRFLATLPTNSARALSDGC